MSQSLEMLKTEEGQLNAIFACYGSAAQHGQYFEKALADLILTIDTRMRNQEVDLSKLTLGQLIAALKGRVNVEDKDEWVWGVLKLAKEKRNFLVHSYFLERSSNFRTSLDRMGMLSELLAIESVIEKAAIVTRGVHSALKSALDDSTCIPESVGIKLSFEDGIEDRIRNMRI